MPSGRPSPSFPPFPPLPLRHSSRRPDVITGEEQFLDAVQGNILKGHGRDHQRLVFFRFTARESGLRCLRAVSVGQLGRDRWVCSAHEQRVQRQVWYTGWKAQEFLASAKASPLMEESGLQADADLANRLLFSSALLSLAGLQFLGLDPPESEAFRCGMKDRMAAMLASDEMQDAPFYPPADFHGVFLLACDDPAALERHFESLCEWRCSFELEFLPGVERGLTWRTETSPYGNDYCPPREPFGFADGISQPRFFTDQRPVPSPGRVEVPGWTDLELADVFIASGGHVGGSLVALLKIEQNVARFRRYEGDIAALLEARLGLTKEIAAYLAPAVIMGRTRQGYPLQKILDQLTPREGDLRGLFPDAPAPDPLDARATPPEMPAWLNDFDFEPRFMTAGAPASGCPFHMHVRKMNPRTTSLPDQGTQKSFVQAQPVRRGATYDPNGLLVTAESAGGVNWPEGEVGLLFLAYMSSLERQFEQSHTHWSRDPTFADKGGVDPVLAQPDPDQQSVPLSFGEVELPAMPKVLKRLGGTYLYAPSIHWLRGAGL